MKKLLLIISLLLLIHLGLNAQNTFNKVFYYFGDSTLTYNEILDLVKLDSSYIMSVLIIDNERGQHIGVIKTDLHGNIIDSIRIHDTSNYFPYPGQSMILTSDSSIVLCSSKHIFNPNSWDGYLLRINRNLDTIWSKNYDIPDTLIGCINVQNPINSFTCITETADNNYLVGVKYYTNCVFNESNFRSYLEKIDTSGNTIWRKIYSDISYIYNIMNSDDSGFYFVGRKNNSFKLFKADKFGNIEWEDIYATIANPIPPTRVARLDSNNLVIASCYWRDFSMDYRGLVLSKYDIKNKNIVWEDTFYLFYNVRTSELHQNFEIKVLENKDIAIATTVAALDWDSLSGGFHAGLFRLNQNGDSLCAHNYHAKLLDEFNRINDFVITEDGGFLLAGYHSPTNMNYNPGAWLLKTDSMGNAPNMHTAGFEGLRFESLMLNIFPNPASDFVKIKFNSQKSKISSYKIYNSQGKMVLSKELLVNDFTINIKEFASGVYFIEATTSSGDRVVEKFVKQ